LASSLILGILLALGAITYGTVTGEISTPAQMGQWMIVSIFAGLILGAWGLRLKLSATKDRQVNREHLRGATLGDPDQIVHGLKKEITDPNDTLTLCRRAALVAPMTRIRPALVIWGRSGAGKGRIITPIISEIARRILNGNGKFAAGGIAFVLDKKGEYVSKLFGYENVYLIAPSDARSHKFQPVIRNSSDAWAFAEIAIPDGAKDPFWRDAPRAVLVGLLLALAGQGNLTWRSLYKSIIDHKRLLRLLDMTPEGREAKDNVKKIEQGAGQSINQILKTALAFVVSLSRAWGSEQTFDLNDFIQSRSGIVVLRFDTDNKILSERVLTLFLEFAIRACLARFGEIYDASPTNFRKEGFFILDEFESLLKIASFGELIKTGRSRGLLAIVATQSTEGVKEVYGPGGLAGIAENSTSIILACKGESAKYLSTLLGDKESLVTRESRAKNVMGGDQIGGESTSQDTHTGAVVLAGEIASLKVATSGKGLIEGFFSIANYPTAKFEWDVTTDALPDQCQPFVPAPWTQTIEMITPEAEPEDEETGKKKVIEPDQGFEPESNGGRKKKAKPELDAFDF